MLITPHLVSHSISDPNAKSYQLSKPEIEFNMMEEMYAASCMCMWRKDDIFRQRRLSIHHV